MTQLWRFTLFSWRSDNRPQCSLLIFRCFLKMGRYNVTIFCFQRHDWKMKVMVKNHMSGLRRSCRNGNLKITWFPNSFEILFSLVTEWEPLEHMRRLRPRLTPSDHPHRHIESLIRTRDLVCMTHAWSQWCRRSAKVKPKIGDKTSWKVSTTKIECCVCFALKHPHCGNVYQQRPQISCHISRSNFSCLIRNALYRPNSRLRDSFSLRPWLPKPVLGRWTMWEPENDFAIFTQLWNYYVSPDSHQVQFSIVLGNLLTALTRHKKCANPPKCARKWEFGRTCVALSETDVFSSMCYLNMFLTCISWEPNKSFFSRSLKNGIQCMTWVVNNWENELTQSTVPTFLFDWKM